MPASAAGQLPHEQLVSPPSPTNSRSPEPPNPVGRVQELRPGPARVRSERQLGAHSHRTEALTRIDRVALWCATIDGSGCVTAEGERVPERGAGPAECARQKGRSKGVI
jgi:hypothetical protein